METTFIYGGNAIRCRNITDVKRFLIERGYPITARNLRANEFDSLYTNGEFINLMAIIGFYRCDYNEGYFFSNAEIYHNIHIGWGDTRRHYIGRHNQISEDEAGYMQCEYDGNHYSTNRYEFFETEDGNMVVEHNRAEIHESEDGYYYLFEDNMPEPARYLNCYHSKRSGFDNDFKPEIGQFIFGFEAEKEDIKVRESVNIKKFDMACPDWRKEADSSLDVESGFELISPIFPLSERYVKKHIESNEILLNHMNADVSSNCGGHMSISRWDESTHTTFDNISGYIPILFAMYYGRMRNDYSLADTKVSLKHSSGRKAIFVRSERIEIRLFPAIKNLKQLLFRIRLLEFITINPNEDYQKAKKLIQKNFNPLFSAVYDRVQFASMLKRADVYAVDYEFHVNSPDHESELI